MPEAFPEVALRVEPVADGVGVLAWDGTARGEATADAASWWADPAARDAVSAVLEAAFAAGTRRVEVEVPVTERDLRRTLHRAGLRPEGTARGRGKGPDGLPVDLVRLARLADDALPGTREGFLSMLNATLPTKRVIGQGVIRDGSGAVLLCELVYKREWDLPGGVVDPRESPARTVAREIGEELSVSLAPGPLLAVNWLPPYRQWEDAVLLVFDLGVHPDLVERVVLERAELRAVHWCRPEDLAGHVAPYVERHLTRILAADPGAGPLYLEDGEPRSGTGSDNRSRHA